MYKNVYRENPPRHGESWVESPRVLETAWTYRLIDWLNSFNVFSREK